MVRLLILSQYWQPENGVPQRRWSWLAQMLEDMGHEISVITTFPNYRRNVTWQQWLNFDWADGCNPIPNSNGRLIFRVPFIPSGNSLSYRAINQGFISVGMIVKALQTYWASGGERPQLIIGTVPALPTALATWILSKILHAPYVIDLRDAWPDLLQESSRWNTSIGKRSLREKLLSKGPLQLALPLVGCGMERVLASADGIMVTSDFLRKELEERLPSLSRSRRIVTVRNVFPSKIKPESPEDVEKPKGEFHVLYAGTLGRAQNLENAIAAAEIASAKGLDVHLRFIGEGATKRDLDRLARLSPVDVEFRPQKAADNLFEDYAWADTALVHLTNWEPLERAVPSKTYELMSAKVHISGVLSGETASLIKDLHAGDVVPPEDPDALACLWLDLAANPDRLLLADQAKDWVAVEQGSVVPQRLKEFLKRVLEH